MRQHSQLITVIGGALAVCCFALPWVAFTKGSYERIYDTNVRTERLGGATLRSSTPVIERRPIITPRPENPSYISRIQNRFRFQFCHHCNHRIRSYLHL